MSFFPLCELDAATGTASSEKLAATATLLTNGQNWASASNFNTASISPTANKLILLFTINTNSAGGTAAAPTGITGAGLTFTKVREITTETSFSQFSVWCACDASVSTGALTISHAVSKSTCQWMVIELTDTIADPADNGLGALAQAFGFSTGGSDVNVNSGAWLSEFLNVGYATVMGWAADTKANTPTTTSATGFTELVDQHQATGLGWDIHQSSYFKDSADKNAVIVASQAAASNFKGIISLEIMTPASGPVAYTLDAAAGSYVLTGTAAGLKWAHKLVAGTATYAYTGATAGLKRGYKVGAGTATYSISGQAAVLRATRKLAAAVAAYTLTGAVANLRRSRFLVAGTASYTITGFATSLRRNSKLASGTASYVLTGSAADLDHDKRLVAGAGAYVYTGQPATLTHVSGDAFVTAGVGTYVLTGSTAGLRKTYRMVAGAGAYTTTFQPANLKTARKLAAGTSSYVITGSPAAMRRSYRLVLAPGTYTFSYQPAGLKHNTRLSAQSGAYIYTGLPATLTKTEREHHMKLVAEPGSYVFDYHDVVELVSSTPVYRRINYGKYGGRRLGTG